MMMDRKLKRDLLEIKRHPRSLSVLRKITVVRREFIRIRGKKVVFQSQRKKHTLKTEE